MVSALAVGTNTYVTRTEANTYMDDSLRGEPWTSVSGPDRDRSLITATRLLEKARWQGARNGGDSQTLAHPRSGLTDCDGRVVASATVAQQVKDAQIELAFELSQDSTIETSAGTGSNEKRLKAGSAELEFFRPTAKGSDGQGSQRFPTVVQELIACFLQSSSSGPTSSGTTVESSFDCADTLGLTEGLA